MSASCAVTVTVVPAAGDAVLLETRYCVGTTTVVTPPLVPVRSAASVAVNVYVTPAVVPVVKTIVATPAAFVVELELANEPPAPVFVQVTTTPCVATGWPLASVSCALIVTAPPATTVAAFADTTYFVAGPAMVVIPALLPVMAL